MESKAPEGAGGDEQQSGQEQLRRPDQRLNWHVRELKVERSLLHRADGSVRVSQGKTCVLVALHGPMAVESRKEKIDRAAIEVVFKSRASLNNQNSYDVEKGQFLAQALEAVVVSDLYPRTKIQLVVQVMEDDGALLATCINAATVALLDAGIQCSSTAFAVAVALAQNEELLVDPLAAEEADARGVATVAFTSAPATVPVVGAGPAGEDSSSASAAASASPGSAGLVSLDLRGVWSETQVRGALRIAQLGCAAVGRRVKDSISAALRRQAAVLADNQRSAAAAAANSASSSSSSSAAAAAASK